MELSLTIGSKLMLLLLHINQVMYDHDTLCNVIAANTPRPGDSWFRDPIRQTYYYCYWIVDVSEMEWISQLLARIGSSRSLDAFSLHDDENDIISLKVSQMDIRFMRNEFGWIASSNDHPKVVGIGLTQAEAERDFQDRSINGWYEGRLDRLITAIKAGLAERLKSATKGTPEYTLLMTDTLDAQALISAVQKGNFIIFCDDDLRISTTEDSIALDLGGTDG